MQYRQRINYNVKPGKFSNKLENLMIEEAFWVELSRWILEIVNDVGWNSGVSRAKHGLQGSDHKIDFDFSFRENWL